MEQVNEISIQEQQEIDNAISYELTDKNFHLLRNASIVSIITACLPVWAFYNAVDRPILLGWFAAMLIVHLVCIGLVFYYEHNHPNPAQIKPWKYIGRVAVLVSTLTWGSMGILLVPDTVSGQNFVLFFLIIISSSVALGTSVNYLTSSVGILSALTPFIIWQFHAGLIHHSSEHIHAGVILILYMLFLHVVSWVSYRLMKKSVELSFANIALAKKLVHVNGRLHVINNELEERVALRTQELNSALTTVTYQANHDSLTTLNNQNWLLKNLEMLVMKAKQQNFTFGLACLSINNMENITDRYGYQANDTLIKEVSQRLTVLFEKISTVTKHYKIAISRRDVFVIVIEPIDADDIQQSIQPILKAFDQPFEIIRQDVADKEQIFVSLGLSIFPKDGSSANDLLLKADSTMFYIKKEREHNYEHLFELYNDKIAEEVQYKVQLRKSMQLAMDKEEFFLFYQPLVDIKENRVVSTEALIRWIHPTEGNVSPSKFIKVAEDYNLIIPLGEWALRKACSQNYKWYKLGFNTIVSVNLSAKQLERGDIVQTIADALHDTGLPANLLDIELTETEAFKNDVVEIINNLKGLGVSLTIDDYGQGFSNLSNLKKFSFDKIKIDMEFIKSLPEDVHSQIIVTNSIKMAKDLGIKVVAEGVERQEQYDFLKKHGCDLIQGYLLHKPVTADDVTAILLSQKYTVK